jgi:hypothetical protein
LLPIVVIGLIVWNASAEGSLFLSVGIGLAGAAIMLWMFFAFRRIQNSDWKKRLRDTDWPLALPQLLQVDL